MKVCNEVRQPYVVAEKKTGKCVEYRVMNINDGPVPMAWMVVSYHSTITGALNAKAEREG